MQIGAALLGAMDERHGLPRPDWGAVQARWLALPDDAQPAAWSAVERAWQWTLAAVWGGDFRVLERGDAVLTTDLPDVEAQKVLLFMDKALRTIERCLTGLGLDDYSDGGPGCDVAVVCRRVEDYLDFVCDAQDEMHVGAVSGGMCIHGGSVHVAAHGKSLEELNGTLAHELAHSRLAGLGLPTWLEEGLVVHLEQAVEPSEFFAPDLQTVALHRGYWTPTRLSQFFSGEGFCGPDDAHGLAYHLAHAVVGNLMADDSVKLAAFFQAASWEDSGEGACVAVYGVTPIELVPGFILAAAQANADAVDETDDEQWDDSAGLDEEE